MERQDVIDRCLHHFKQGSLTEEELKEYLLQIANAPKSHQSILYLFWSGSSLNSSVVGMAITQNGELTNGPDNPDDWPYKKVMDAINDGWRIIHFPRVAQSSSDLQEFKIISPKSIIVLTDSISSIQERFSKRDNLQFDYYLLQIFQREEIKYA